MKNENMCPSLMTLVLLKSFKIPSFAATSWSDVMLPKSNHQIAISYRYGIFFDISFTEII